MWTSSFLDFINEQYGRAPLLPSHEELAELPWIKALNRVLGTIDLRAEWTTGARSFANGNRKLQISGVDLGHSRLHHRLYDMNFIFYTANGSVVLGQGGRTIAKERFNFMDLYSWNEAAHLVYLYVISRCLGTNVRELRKILAKRDSAIIFVRIGEIRQLDHLTEEQLPDSFAWELAADFADPEELEAVRQLSELGLI